MYRNIAMDAFAYNVLNPTARAGITAFTSERANMSPFAKGCRERGASM
jgi:hypothetical protein